MVSFLSPLNLCTDYVLQKFNSINYLGNRKVCLIGGAAILFCALTVILVPNLLYSSENSPDEDKKASQIDKSRKKFSSRVANGRPFSEQAVLNETLILKFLSHPKAPQLILEGRRKLQDFAAAAYPAVQIFGETYPNCPEVQHYVEKFSSHCRPFPYEDIIVPFLCLGVVNTSGVTDQTTLKAIQAFQVRIFKYWLSLYRIGEQDRQLFKDLLDFCKTSSLDLFSKAIGPFLASFIREDKEDDEDYYDEVICFFIEAEWAEYSEKSQGGYRNPAIKKICEDIAKEINQQLEEDERNKSPGEKLVEEFQVELASKYSLEDKIDQVQRSHFSRDAIIALFLEVNESRNPLQGSRK